MDAVVKILGVAVRATNSGRQVFDVQCSDGIDRACWNAGLAQKINSFANNQGQGPDVTLRFEVKQNGQYTNYNVKGVFGPGEAVPADTGGGNAFQGGGNAGGGRPGGGGGSFPPEVTTRIVKMASFETAAQLVGQLFAGAGPEAFEQAWSLVEEASKRIYKASRSHESGGTTTTGSALPQGQPATNMLPQGEGQIVPVADTPQGVAATLPPGTVQVGTAAAQDAAAEAPDTIEWD